MTSPTCTVRSCEFGSLQAMSTINLPTLPEALDAEDYPPRIGGRIPSLDGLRAVAILLVVKYHLAGSFYSLPGLGVGRFAMRLTLGNLGVRLFFVISGFLITTLLLKEQEKRGRISLGQFYIRRALRILPASYAFLLIMLFAVGVGILAIPRESFIASLLYFRNYIANNRDWYTAHLWSLSVEEQFYLIWPATMLLLGRKRAVFAAFCTLPLADAMRLFRLEPQYGFETNMDALACGCILACIWGSLGQNELWQRFLRSRLFWVVPIGILASNKLTLVGGPWLAVGTGLANVLIAVSVERFVRYHGLGAAKLLNLRAAVIIGTLSYSLYIWQQPWVVMMGGHGLLQTFPINVVLACVCAVLSYTLIERPFLSLKDRWQTAR